MFKYFQEFSGYPKRTLFVYVHNRFMQDTGYNFKAEGKEYGVKWNKRKQNKRKEEKNALVMVYNIII